MHMDITEVEKAVQDALVLYVLPANLPEGAYYSESDTHEYVAERASYLIAEKLKPLFAKVWTEAFDKGFYDPLAGGCRDASESAHTNPYETPKEG